MGVLDFLKKKDGQDVPPDVGKEEIASPSPGTDAADGSGAPFDPGELPPASDDSQPGNADKPSDATKTIANSAAQSGNGRDDAMIDLKIERLDAKIESLNGLLKGMNERMSGVSEQIGEIRGMALSNEKEIGKLAAETAKAIDVVNEVKPEQIRFDYEKSAQRAEELAGKIEANKEYIGTLTEELKELRRKAESFIGTEGLIAMQQDVKKDLVNIQQIGAKAQMHADKAEQLFIETSKMSNEYNQVLETLNNFEANYSSLKKDFEKIKLDFTEIATKKDMSDLKKRVENKIAMIDASIEHVDRMKSDNDRILKLFETAVALTKKNEKEITDIALRIGDDHIDKAAEYDDKLRSLLVLIDTIAGQVTEIRKRVGITNSGVKMPRPSQVAKQGGTIELKNIDIKPEDAKSLQAVKLEVAAAPEAKADAPEAAENPSPAALPAAETSSDAEQQNVAEKNIEDANPIQSTTETPASQDASPIVQEDDADITSKEGSAPESLPIETEKTTPESSWNPAEAEMPAVSAHEPEHSEESTRAEADWPDKLQATPEIAEIAKSVKTEEPYASNEKAKRHHHKHVKRKQHYHGIEDAPESSDFDLQEPSSKPYFPPSGDLESDEKIYLQIRKELAEGFAALDKSNKRELEMRYVSMKQLYDSLSRKDAKVYRQILDFYERMNSKFYTSVFS